MERFKRVLSVAGSDSGGGAGIQADLKTIAACGCYGMTAITAVTVQNTQGVRGVYAVPADVVAGQIDAVLEDIGVDAVKLGMLPSEEIIAETARLIRKYGVRHVVMDPVMIATSGDRLVAESAVEAILRHIFPLAALVTPNIPEAEYLTGLAGHLQGAELTEYLYTADGVEQRYRYERIDTPNTHGTGCTLSSAVASFLAQGHELPEAVRRAEDYVHGAIMAGREYRTGCGHGPVHHFYRFWK